MRSVPPERGDMTLPKWQHPYASLRRGDTLATARTPLGQASPGGAEDAIGSYADEVRSARHGELPWRTVRPRAFHRRGPANRSTVVPPAGRLLLLMP